MTDISQRYTAKAVSSLGLRTVLRETRNTHCKTLRPTVLIFLSPSSGQTDFIRLGCPVILNDRFSNTVTFCLDHLEYNEHKEAFNISKRVLSLFPITILVSREKIDEASFAALKLLRERYPKIRLIIDIDDDLYALPENHPEYQYYQTRLGLLNSLIDISDIVVVSTEPVLDSLQNAENRIESHAIIPNYLDDRIWDVNQREALSRTIRVLYSGTETHDADLRLLETVIPKVKKRVEDHGREIEFVVVGGTTVAIDGMTIIPVPADKRSYPAYAQWLQSMNDFSFAIAPLDLKNKMNHAKSGLKYLEYSAMGLPALFTDIEPYRNIVEDGTTGVLIPENDAQVWEDQLVNMALDDEKRSHLSQACRADLKQHLLLSDHFDEWKQVISK